MERIHSAAEAAAQRRKDQDAQIEDAKKHLKSDVDFRNSVRLSAACHVLLHAKHADSVRVRHAVCHCRRSKVVCRPVVCVACTRAGRGCDGRRNQQPGVHGRRPGWRQAKAAAMRASLLHASCVQLGAM